MTLINERPETAAVQAPHYPREERLGRTVIKWITSTDHKTIGYMYLMLGFAFFIIGGAMALVMRAELARPGMQFLTNEQFNMLFTMHGTIMLFLFATPLFVGFANIIVPLQIGAPDVAFPRLNMLGFVGRGCWLYWS